MGILRAPIVDGTECYRFSDSFMGIDTLRPYSEFVHHHNQRTTKLSKHPSFKARSFEHPPFLNG